MLQPKISLICRKLFPEAAAVAAVAVELEVVSFCFSYYILQQRVISTKFKLIFGGFNETSGVQDQYKKKMYQEISLLIIKTRLQRLALKKNDFEKV